MAEHHGKGVSSEDSTEQHKPADSGSDSEPVDADDTQTNIAVDNIVAEDNNKEDGKPSDGSSDADDETTPSSSEIPEEDSTEKPTEVVSSEHQKQGKMAAFKHWIGHHKVVIIIVALLVVIGVLTAVPFTRYKIAGLVLKQTISVQVLDSQTHKPVTSAVVMVRSASVKTDNQGIAKLHVAVGTTQVMVSKTYYQSFQTKTLVPIGKPKQPVVVDFKATGRQVPIVVDNTISGKPIENAQITAANSEVKTDKNGQATIVLPADKTSVAATVKLAGYNDASVTVTVTGQVVAANTFAITPAGKVYFLSNLSGKIDVVKTNLDGTARQTVLAGTGQEDPQNTSLLASRDWKYLALLSKRDGGDNAKIFLIDTSTDKVTTMDEGTATFSLVGWSGHTFVYSVDRSNILYWQANRTALKSYNAETGALATLDQNGSAGDNTNNSFNYAYQILANYYLIGSQVVYDTGWVGAQSQMSGKVASIRSVNIDGSNKKDVKTFDATQYNPYSVQVGADDPQSVYFAFLSNANDAKPEFYEYENGAVAPATDVTLAQIQVGYPTFLLSPSGSQTFWSDVRDGKNALFVGDKDAQSPQQILGSSEQIAYGWYTDGYVLSAKSGSELYIMSAAGGKQIKISDYYKPAIAYRGYGGGYGGL